MVDITRVIQQIRQYCPIFHNRVWGAAKYNSALTNNADAGLEYPSAFVLPLATDVDSPNSYTGAWQNAHETFSVFVVLDNSADNLGGFGAEQIGEVENCLLKAIYNWRIDDVESSRGIYFIGGKIEDYDRTRLFYQFVFGLDRTITDADGFIPDYPDLTDVRLFDTNHPPLEVDIPQ